MLAGAANECFGYCRNKLDCVLQFIKKRVKVMPEKLCTILSKAFLQKKYKVHHLLQFSMLYLPEAVTT